MSRLKGSLTQAYLNDRVRSASRDVRQARQYILSLSPPETLTPRTPPSTTHWDDDHTFTNLPTLPTSPKTAHEELSTAKFTTAEAFIEHIRAPLERYFSTEMVNSSSIDLLDVLQYLHNSYAPKLYEGIEVHRRVQHLTRLAEEQRAIINRQESMIQNFLIPPPQGQQSSAGNKPKQPTATEVGVQTTGEGSSKLTPTKPSARQGSSAGMLHLQQSLGEEQQNISQKLSVQPDCDEDDIACDGLKTNSTLDPVLNDPLLSTVPPPTPLTSRARAKSRRDRGLSRIMFTPTAASQSTTAVLSQRPLFSMVESTRSILGKNGSLGSEASLVRALQSGVVVGSVGPSITEEIAPLTESFIAK